MKLYSVLLLICFSWAFIFVGLVHGNNITEEDHDAGVDGPYAAEAHAYRYDRIDVRLVARASSTEWGKNGGYFLTLERLKPNNTQQLDHENHWITNGGPIDGHFFATLPLNLPHEDDACRARSLVSGFRTDGKRCQVEVDAQVGPMPPPEPPPYPEPGIYPIDPTDTPSPGERHGYKLITSEPYYYVGWYVKAPWDTSERGEFIEGDNGDGTATTATMYYTYPSGAMHTGDFLITAVISRWSDMSQYEETYTATVVLE